MRLCRLLGLVAALAVCSETMANQATPTTLEAFAGASDTRVKQQIEVGRLESSDAALKITAVVLVNDGSHPGEMHGVRFELENNVGMDVIYLDPAQLDRLRKDLNGLEIRKAALSDLGDQTPYQVQGTATCWNPKSTARIMCPGLYTTPDGVGISLGALFSPAFQFPDRSAKDIMQLVEASLRARGEPVPAIEAVKLSEE